FVLSVVNGPFPSMRGISFPTCLRSYRHRGFAASLVPEPFGQKTPRVKEKLRRKAKGVSPDFLHKRTSGARELSVNGYPLIETAGLLCGESLSRAEVKAPRRAGWLW